MPGSACVRCAVPPANEGLRVYAGQNGPLHTVRVENSVRKILVLVDAAAASQLSLNAAVELVQQDAAKLDLFDCRMGNSLPLGWAGDPEADRQYLALLKSRRLADLEALADPLRSRGLQVSTASDSGALLEEALALHILESAPDLIITEVSAPQEAASWQAQTQCIVYLHARCPVVLVGSDRWRDSVRQALSRTCEGAT